MPANLNIFNLDLGENLAKLLNKGRIYKAYNKMYKLANRLAAEETKTYIMELAALKPRTPARKGLELFCNYRKDRITFHMNEMEKLLKISLKEQSKKNDE